MNDRALELAVTLLLLGIAAILLAEAILPFAERLAFVQAPMLRIIVGLIVGIGIGMVSSLLGVAGGELIIPVMLLLFGADIKTAGTASLAISLPMVSVGVARYALAGTLADRGAMREVAAPMAVGSILGAALGGLLIGLAPDAAIKLMLGVILTGSALKMLHRRRQRNTSEE